jgi:hypothetical protein
MYSRRFIFDQYRNIQFDWTNDQSSTAGTSKMFDVLKFARGRAMLLYFVSNPDEAENIVRFGFTLRQAAYVGGSCGTGVVIWLVDHPRRFDMQSQACLEVEIPDGYEVVTQLAAQPALPLRRFSRAVRRRSTNAAISADCPTTKREHCKRAKHSEVPRSQLLSRVGRVMSRAIGSSAITV